MRDNFHYGTVTDAINNLRQQGFNIDFNIEGDYLMSHVERIKVEDFEIVDVYRYEGATDPADEAVVYAVESRSGLKGILVTGYGIYSDTVSTQILEKLHSRGE
jgi:hypothetical protein